MPTVRCTGCGEVLHPRDVAEHKCPEPEMPGCSKCGVSEEDSQWGVLIPIEVMANGGEEGHAEVTQLLCDECAILVLEALEKLGFVDHRHGGANLLEDKTCPGSKNMHTCPTPTKYGEVIVPPGGWSNG